jgi:hypothetical protein
MATVVPKSAKESRVFPDQENDAPEEKDRYGTKYTMTD